VRRLAPWVVVASLLLAVWCAHYTMRHIGINTDTADMIVEDLAWRQAYIEYKEKFPEYVDNLVLVLEGTNPDHLEQASEALAARLQREGGLVRWVYRPGAGPFFERHGLLYLDVERLQDLADNLAAIQPFLGRLAADPSLRGFFGVLGDALDAAAEGERIELAPVLEEVAAVVEAGLAERERALSWRRLMLGEAGERATERRFVLVKPKLDYGELFPAAPVMERVRRIAAELGLEEGARVRLRITGGLALAHEELQSVSRGAGLATAVALVLVAAVLLAGLRSVRLAAASLLTLVVGLIWTAAFATGVVGELNLISVAFAVLYIGLGVAYAVHYCLRYRELVCQGITHAAALRASAGDVGGSLVLCAVTTGIGFFAFVPTDFAGVSELGLISGTGMFISLATTLTLLPALLTLMPLRPPPPQPERGTGLKAEILSAPLRWRRPLLAGAGLLGVAAAAAVPDVRFDHNPLNLRDPGAESVQTYRDLMAESRTSPWSAVVLADDAEAAARLESRLQALPAVEAAVSLADFVPQRQAQKLDIIDELTLLLGPTLLPGAQAPAAPSFEERRSALRALRERLEAFPQAHAGAGLARAVAALEAALAQLDGTLAGATEDAAAARLARLERDLVGTLPRELRRLRRALDAGPVTAETLPQDLASRWVGPDGRHRVEVLPAENLDEQVALARFVDQVHTVVPQATGSPVVILESGRAVVGAFQQAFVLAALLITLVLLALMRSPRSVALVLSPLLLAGLFTVAAMTLLDIPFNFANVIALPLLLGVGVDNGIHMVNRMRTAPPAGGNLLRTSTSRAVVTSAVVTVVSFGNLAFSSHQGMASMGALLSIGLGFTLICTLVVLPVMLAPKRRNGTA